jgi:hypothetical protein
MVERVRLSEMLVRCLPRCLPRAGAPRPVASRPDNAGDVERVGRAAVAMLEAETTPVAHRRRAADTAAGADSRVPEHKPEPCGRAQRRRHVQVRRQARGRAVLESAHCSGPPRQPLAHESCRARCGDAFGDDHELSPGPTPLRWRPAFVRRAADDRFVGETSVAKAQEADEPGVSVPQTSLLMAAAAAGALIGVAIVLVWEPGWNHTQQDRAASGPFVLWVALIAAQAMLWAVALPSLVEPSSVTGETGSGTRCGERSCRRPPASSC